jgi:hypothetical protein
MRFAKGYSFLNRSAPCTDAAQRHRARITVTKDRLNATPAAPPVLARARRLARPLVGPTIAAERLAEDWTDRVPAIAEALRSLRVTSPTLDGEGVVCDDRGLSDFDRLRSALARRGGSLYEPEAS